MPICAEEKKCIIHGMTRTAIAVELETVTKRRVLQEYDGNGGKALIFLLLERTMLVLAWSGGGRRPGVDVTGGRVLVGVTTDVLIRWGEGLVTGLLE